MVVESTSYHELRLQSGNKSVMHVVYQKTMQGKADSFGQTTAEVLKLLPYGVKTLFFSPQMDVLGNNKFEALTITDGLTTQA
jgi:hypothetical protein